jgi:hypothetical protein
LTFAHSCSIGLKSGEYGGKNHSSACAAAMACRTRSDLWLDKLSITTTSPGRSCGTRPSSTNVANASLSVAPAKNTPAQTPLDRKAPIMVVTCQWPQGTASTTRAPRGPRP